MVVWHQMTAFHMFLLSVFCVQTKDFLSRHFPLFHAAHPCCSVMHQTAFCTFCMLSRLLLARDPVSGDGGELCGLHLECCHILSAVSSSTKNCELRWWLHRNIQSIREVVVLLVFWKKSNSCKLGMNIRAVATYTFRPLHHNPLWKVTDSVQDLSSYFYIQQELSSRSNFFSKLFFPQGNELLGSNAEQEPLAAVAKNECIKSHIQS